MSRLQQATAERIIIQRIQQSPHLNVNILGLFSHKVEISITAIKIAGAKHVFIHCGLPYAMQQTTAVAYGYITYEI